MGSENDGCVAFEDEEWDFGPVQRTGEEERGKAAAGDEDWLGGAHGGRWVDSECGGRLTRDAMAPIIAVALGVEEDAKCIASSTSLGKWGPRRSSGASKGA